MSRYSRGGIRGPGELAVSDRKHANKAKSAKQFRRNIEHTKAVNITPRSAGEGVFYPGTMRGGIRL